MSYISRCSIRPVRTCGPLGRAENPRLQICETGPVETDGVARRTVQPRFLLEHVDNGEWDIRQCADDFVQVRDNGLRCGIVMTENLDKLFNGITRLVMTDTVADIPKCVAFTLKEFASVVDGSSKNIFTGFVIEIGFVAQIW